MSCAVRTMSCAVRHDHSMLFLLSQAFTIALSYRQVTLLPLVAAHPTMLLQWTMADSHFRSSPTNRGRRRSNYRSARCYEIVLANDRNWLAYTRYTVLWFLFFPNRTIWHTYIHTAGCISCLQCLLCVCIHWHKRIMNMCWQIPSVYMYYYYCISHFMSATTFNHWRYGPKVICFSCPAVYSMCMSHNEE